MGSDISAYLAAARDPTAVGASAEAARMRVAYLDLLKLSLCDLAGSSTGSVGRMEDGRLVSRRLVGDDRQVRLVGMDWPLQGLTMVGLARLDDLQRCVESVVGDRVEGDLVEAGAWRGGASILIRATLDSLGAEERTVWVADSFRGFPSSEAGGITGGRDLDDDAPFEFLSVPLEEVRDHFSRLGYEDGVRFVPGFFQETMPTLRGRRWALIRLDGDTYEATRLTLEALYPGLAVGGYLVVDDYGVIDDCRRAVDEYRSEQGITEPLEEVDWASVRWRRETAGPEEPSAPAPAGPEPSVADAQAAVADRSGAEVPTDRERALENELEALRGRFDRAEVEAARGWGGVTERAASWVRRLANRRRP
ncbi:MAG: macrocin O-methyltransferase [Solirubrobacterales bacterium]|nr:macrocin O-methyltransferase [Solirubrobacterales bacterium]